MDETFRKVDCCISPDCSFIENGVQKPIDLKSEIEGHQIKNVEIWLLNQAWYNFDLQQEKPYKHTHEIKRLADSNVY